MKASLFRHGLNLWPPFLFAGIHVTEVTPDYRYVRVELRMRPWNKNYCLLYTSPSPRDS